MLSETERRSPLAKTVYCARHARLTAWLNSGVPPADVAAWAGNSVAVLLSTCAQCISGQQGELRRRVEAAGDLDGLE